MKYILAAVIAFFSSTAISKVHHLQHADTDDECIAYALKIEARGEPVEGQRAVLDVILNRMRIREKNACAVIKEPGQFPWYKVGMKLHPSMEDMLRFAQVLDMESILPNTTQYFHAGYVHPKWSRVFTKVATIGHHRFYADEKDMLYAAL